MNASKFEALLKHLLDAAQDPEFIEQYSFDEDLQPIEDASIRSFDEAGLLTRDNGLVIRLNDGSEFQMTIIQSR